MVSVCLSAVFFLSAVLPSYVVTLLCSKSGFQVGRGKDTAENDHTTSAQVPSVRQMVVQVLGLTHR